MVRVVRGAGRKSGACQSLAVACLRRAQSKFSRARSAPTANAAFFLRRSYYRSFSHNVRILASSVIAILTNSARRNCEKLVIHPAATLRACGVFVLRVEVAAGETALRVHAHRHARNTRGLCFVVPRCRPRAACLSLNAPQHACRSGDNGVERVQGRAEVARFQRHLPWYRGTWYVGIACG